MPSPAESAALITLLRGGEGSWSEYAERVEDAGSALAVLEAERLVFAEDLAAAEREVGGWLARGWRLLTVMDPDYPANLRGVWDRPPLVFVAGALSDADARAVAVIGSRAASPSGLAAARRVAGRLVADGFVVVSGLAAGVDASAHREALACGGRTVAVIGTGLSCAYPPQNAALQAEIAERGAVVSRFWPDAGPTRSGFPLRNAVMSGLSLATVIVEAGPTSGARVQARFALAHGRPVFLLKAVLGTWWARELARRPNVHVVRGPEEITRVVERVSGRELIGG